MDDLAEFLARTVKTCLQNGMSLPLTLVLMGINGSVSVSRYFRSESGELDVVEITNHIEGTGLELPLNVMISDSEGKAARALFRVGQPTQPMSRPLAKPTAPAAGALKVPANKHGASAPDPRAEQSGTHAPSSGDSSVVKIRPVAESPRKSKIMFKPDPKPASKPAPKLEAEPAPKGAATTQAAPPPILAFALGWAGLWITRGFRR